MQFYWCLLLAVYTQSPSNSELLPVVHKQVVDYDYDGRRTKKRRRRKEEEDDEERTQQHTNIN